ncbi:MAG TPA: hydroxyisourate hydrolase [Terracidiphilus sp.]|nr:hydroxyisourate hydrolase [Terracidiphilus sp.]
MSRISTHVLDTATGRPAAGIAMRLEAESNGVWNAIAEGATDADGRWKTPAENAAAGEYRIVFLTARYFSGQGRRSLYPEIAVTFTCDGETHYHLPVLLSENGYTTYRGS